MNKKKGRRNIYPKKHFTPATYVNFNFPLQCSSAAASAAEKKQNEKITAKSLWDPGIH